jgi:flagellar P-ring protein precursor FlgI
MSRVRFLLICLGAHLLCLAGAAQPADIRIKDVIDVEGVRDNALTGLGLVVGLNNTGGKSPITRRLSVNVQQNFDIRLDPEIRNKLRLDTREKTNSLSAVIVTAHLPPFSRKGQKIDVTVSTFDDATSLFGGQLIMTPLVGADGEVYAVAEGPISVDSISVSGAAASVQKNHPTSGRITNGANIERELCTTIAVNGRVRLLLRDPDFETATRITKAINLFMPLTSRALDPRTIELTIPPSQSSDVTGFLASVGTLRIQPDVKARVVINERTGTIAIGENVRLSRVLITHANLAIFTKESPQVSQPEPFSQGETVVAPRTDLNVVEEDRPIHEIEDTTTVGDLAQSLNALGVAPRDLGVIFQQLRDAGALHAELEFK